MIWTTWRYSDVIEYAIVKSHEKTKLMEDIEDLDCESVEGYTIALLSAILQRMN